MKKTLLSLISLLSFALVSEAQVPSYISKDSLIGYWSFTGNADDESGNQNSGTVMGATLTADRNQNPNSAYSFNGTTNYIDFPTLFKTKAPASFTISWWLYSTRNSAANNQLVGKNSWGSFVFHTMDDGSVYVGTDLGGRFTPTQLPAGTVSLNKWQNFVFVYENGKGSFYKDGKLLASKTGMSNSGVWGGMTLGHSDGSHSISGYADDLAIWGKALSADEVNTTFESIITSSDKYQENESLGNVLYPNPTSDYLFINSNSNYKIVSANGVEVSNGVVEGNSIDVSSLESGVYYLQLIDTKSTSTLKFVKK